MILVCERVVDALRHLLVADPIGERLVDALVVSGPDGVSPDLVFRVSLFPAVSCFAVFRVSAFGRGRRPNGFWLLLAYM